MGWPAATEGRDSCRVLETALLRSRLGFGPIGLFARLPPWSSGLQPGATWVLVIWLVIPTLRGMITISSSLAQHQRGTNRTPALLATSSATRLGTEVQRWTRYYTGGEADAPHAIACPNDGLLVRVRNTAGTIYAARVASAAPTSTYSAWTNIATSISGGPVALAYYAAALVVLYADAAGTSIKMRSSADSGATWSAESAVVTEASAIGSLAATMVSSGALCAFYTLGTTTTLKRIRRTSGGVWGAAATWTNTASVATLTGVASTHNGGDYQLLVTGTEAATNNKRVWGCLLGDGNFPVDVWSGLTNVAESDSLSTVSFKGPGLMMLGSNTLGAFAQAETANVASTRAYFTHPPAASGVTGQWRDGSPFDASSAYGVAIGTASSGSAGVWATTAYGVWYAPRSATTTLTTRVIAARFEQTPDHMKARVEFDNRDGTLTVPDPTATPHTPNPPLMTGGSLSLSPGYASGAGGAAEYGVAHVLTIERLTYTTKDGRAIVIADCIGPWDALASWRAPQAWQTAAGATTRSAIFTRICARAGVPVSGAGSANWTTYTPAFAIAAGETGQNVAERLLAVASDYVRTNSSGLVVRPLAASDASNAAYGGTGEHPIESLELVDTPARYNWTRLQGPDRYADSVAYAEIYQHGPRFEVVRSQDATTDARATAYVADAARRRVVNEYLGTLRAPLHAGQELYDVVTLTYSRMGLSATTRRIIGIVWEYRRAGGGLRTSYTATYTLGGV